MVSKNSGFFKPKTILFMLFISIATSVTGQNTIILDSVLSKVFDTELLPAKTKTIAKKNKPILIISNLNCAGCVKYFTREQKDYTLLFILQSESLLEAERIKEKYKLTGKNIYFTTSEYIHARKELLCQKPTPCCILPGANDMLLYDYNELSQLTNEFTLNHSDIKAAFKNSSTKAFTKN